MPKDHDPQARVPARALAEPAADTVVRIPRLYNGPPHSANGGWTGGLLARRLQAGSAAVSVSLRAPVPLEQPLQLVATPTGGLRLLQGEQLLAEAEPAEPWPADIPACPTWGQAEAAGALGRWRSQQRGSNWPYAHCFACGIAREDGLQLLPGPVTADAGDGDDARDVVATTWVPAATLAEGGGQVWTEAVWAALDCPAGIAWSQRLPPGAPMVTARISAALLRPVQAGARYRVLGWPIAREGEGGRKLLAGTALFDEAGQLCAHTQQLWLMPRPAA